MNETLVWLAEQMYHDSEFIFWTDKFWNAVWDSDEYCKLWDLDKEVLVDEIKYENIKTKIK